MAAERIRRLEAAMADLRPRRVQGVWHRFVAEPYKDDAGSDRGALDYWRWLVDIPQVVSWVEASYYVPIRRAALPELRSFYAEDPRRQAAFGQVAQAQPRHPQFATWTIYLQEALEAIYVCMRDPGQELDRAQRRALQP